MIAPGREDGAGLLTVGQALQYLKVSRSLLHQYVRRGELAAVKQLAALQVFREAGWAAEVSWRRRWRSWPGLVAALLRRRLATRRALVTQLDRLEDEGDARLWALRGPGGVR